MAFTFWKFLWSTLVVISCLSSTTCDFASTVKVSAFASSSAPLLKKKNLYHLTTTTMPPTTTDVARLRGGGGTGPASTKLAASSIADPAAKKVRIPSFDSLRFFLIATIVLGHFVSFANPSQMLLKLFSQHNITVGAFFVISGYVAAYTSTENAAKLASPKLTNVPKQTWILQKVFGYYPLHLATLLLFSPMFLYADVYYNGWPIALLHGLLSVTMTQAWFPMHAEVWNAPTWYLGALAFCTSLMPFTLPSLAKMDKKQLRKTLAWVFVIYALPKLGYIYDAGALTIFEGITPPKAHPNLSLFNVLRFNPLFQVAEFLLGAVACRLVMMDGAAGEEAAPKTNVLSTAVPLFMMVAMLVARANDLVPTVSDTMVRVFYFIPLFLKLVMSLHRNTVTKCKDVVRSVLEHPTLVWLGNLSFAIYIMHGPIGQIFFKKLIATKIFGQVLRGPGNFALYLATTFCSAILVQKLFLENKSVGSMSKKSVDVLSKWF